VCRAAVYSRGVHAEARPRSRQDPGGAPAPGRRGRCRGRARGADHAGPGSRGTRPQARRRRSEGMRDRRPGAGRGTGQGATHPPRARRARSPQARWWYGRRRARLAPPRRAPRSRGRYDPPRPRAIATHVRQVPARRARARDRAHRRSLLARGPAATLVADTRCRRDGPGLGTPRHVERGRDADDRAPALGGASPGPCSHLPGQGGLRHAARDLGDARTRGSAGGAARERRRRGRPGPARMAHVSRGWRRPPARPTPIAMCCSCTT